NFGGDLAVTGEPHAGRHRIFVNVETATTRVLQLHRPLLFGRRRGAPLIRTLGNVLRGEDRPWRQSAVLRKPRVQLADGLNAPSKRRPRRRRRRITVSSAAGGGKPRGQLPGD